MNRAESKHAPFEAACHVDHVTWSVGAQAAGARPVTIVAKNPDGEAVGPVALDLYVADDDAGTQFADTAPSTLSATTGEALAPVAGKLLKAVTNAAGTLVLSVGHGSAKTVYLVAALPNGKISVSPAVAIA